MELRDRLAEVWPLFGLRVHTPRLELRLPDDDDLLALAAQSHDIHDPDARPFGFPWNVTDGDAERAARVLRHNWSMRGAWTPEKWNLNLVTVVDGQVVGMQGMGADDFATRRTVGSGSWLNRAHQGQGIGTEMRAAMLHLAFVGLGAERAETGAYADNAASLAVTAKNGYVANGEGVHFDGAERRIERRFVLVREDWEPLRRDDIELVGVEPCLPLFGLPPA